MKTVLITAIGGDIGQSIAQCIRNYSDDVFLIGTDIHIKHGGSLFVDKVVIVPYANDPKYLDRISEIVNENDIDVIIPVNENELDVFANTDQNHSLIYCGKKIVNIGLDKLKTIECLKSFRK